MSIEKKSSESDETSQHQQIHKIIQELKNELPGIEAVAVVSVDGLPISSILPSGVEELRVAAMSAALLALGERTTLEFNKVPLEHVMVQGGEGGQILGVMLGNQAILVVVASKAARIGMLLLECRKASMKIIELI